VSTVLVTGGSGFIASHCILQLLAGGHDVRTTVRNPEREGDVRALLKEGGTEAGERLTFVVTDLEKDAGWAEAVADCQYVSTSLPPFRQHAEARRRADRPCAGRRPPRPSSGAGRRRPARRC